jgi:hypothetical protein
MADALRAVDPIARLAEAWDLRGRHPFAAGGREHRALIAMAGIDPKCQSMRWDELAPYQRQALLTNARLAIELGRACAWVFGEGEGARL